jgi:hypothetical protein
MTKVSYPSTSPYAASKQTSWYVLLYKHRPILPNRDDEEFEITAKYEFRPDKLSDDLYGTPEYYWVFAVRNRNLVNDPVWDLTIGKKIIVPTLTHVKKSTGS